MKFWAIVFMMLLPVCFTAVAVIHVAVALSTVA